MEQFLAEQKGLKLASAPVSLTGTPVQGERVSLKEHKRVAVVLQFAASAAAVLEVTLRQHDAASAGNSKDLLVANKWHHKVGAATSFTQLEPSVAAAVYDLVAIVGNNAATVVLEVLQEDLDVNGDFDHVSVVLEGDATARLSAAVYVLDSEYKPAHALEL